MNICFTSASVPVVPGISHPHKSSWDTHSVQQKEAQTLWCKPSCHTINLPYIRDQRPLLVNRRTSLSSSWLLIYSSKIPSPHFTLHQSCYQLEITQQQQLHQSKLLRKERKIIGSTVNTDVNICFSWFRLIPSTESGGEKGAKEKMMLPASCME